jgi:DHA2 family multidrug resistance protein-like MFS transporter
MALLLVLAPRYVPEIRDPEAPRVDVASGALSIAGILATVYAVKQGARGGLEPATAGSLVLGVALLGAFVVRQGRHQRPLVDVRLFARGTFSTAVAASAAGMFVSYGTFFFTSQHLQLVMAMSPLEAGLWGLVPVAAMMVASAGVVPKLAARIRPAHLVAGGMLVSAAGLGLLTQVDPGSGVDALIPALVLIVVGLAPATTLGVNLIMASAPPEQAGSVSGLGQATNELGGALGIALLGTLGTAVYRDDVAGTLGGGLPPDAAGAARDTLGGAVGAAGQLPADVVEAAAGAFTHGMHAAAIAAAAVVLATAALTAFMLRDLPRAAEGEAGGETGSANSAALPEPAGA